MTLVEKVTSLMRKKIPQHQQRPGQAAFNALEEIDHGLAMAIWTNENLDPYHKDENLPNFWAYLSSEDEKRKAFGDGD